MVAFAKDENLGLQPVIMAQPQQSSIVCPKCSRHLSSSAISPIHNRYNGKLRTYFGWCTNCYCGCEVVQFEQGGLWLIHKFRLFKVQGQDDKPEPITRWIIANKLPLPPLVVIGPGGEYDKPFTPETIELVETLHTALKATLKTVESLLKLAKLKK